MGRKRTLVEYEARIGKRFFSLGVNPFGQSHFLYPYLWTKFQYSPPPIYMGSNVISCQLCPEVGWASLHPLIVMSSSSVNLPTTKHQTYLGCNSLSRLIKATFNWSVFLHNNLLIYTSCSVLHCIPCELHGVDDVLSLIRCAEKAKICQGHCDSKYTCLEVS